MDDFWFFGCEREGAKGHYLFDKFGHRLGDDDPRMGFPMFLLDQTFAPVEERAGSFRLVWICRSHGQRLTILAGWDNTVDQRPGSNAAFISHGQKNLAEMLDRAERFFPKQYARLVPLTGAEGRQPFDLVET